MTTPGQLDRYLGCLLGLASGDALGTTVEFSPRGSFAPLTDMVGGGPFDLPAGAWTDDCSMALCLAHSLLHRQGFHAVDQMNRYCNWAELGYLSSTGECFDIGSTVARALAAYRGSGDPFSGSTDPSSAGNGSLMRLAPVPMYYWRDPARVIHFCGESARTTHGAPEAVDSTRLFGAQLRAALAGADKETVLFRSGYQPGEPKVGAIAAGEWRGKDESAIRGSGYAVASLEAALWCFWQSEDFATAVLRAANLGDDADTTAAICGQIAGAYYGVDSIPAHWRERLAMGEEIAGLATRLYQEREGGAD
ncbi:ADP-ribosylglycohydrolase family protein [Cupriavidus basilensis]|uniref:ADP-ribosylglycohydrolase family protein n=1 Tax=Cupriavidus basilensis TaxID=68895 RepID=A0ABT6B2W7_9BURK|nr:ADP-ribosylglycohydrolase family protein [Cupriavidus basilensis]MDF3839222.1 ADP-ribosylglycohydrolase family protein [Cupriavidus basilensis]